MLMMMAESSQPPDVELRWHVLLTEPLAEIRAATRLRQLGFEPYVPTIPRVTQSKVHTLFGVQRRSRKTMRAMFPGYLFLPLNVAWEFGLDKNPRGFWSLVVQTIGLRTGPSHKGNPFLRINGMHAILSDEKIEIIREVEKREANPAVPGLPYRVGDRVKLLEGPFADMVGTISKLEDAERIEILMEMLGRKTRTHITARQITAA